MDTSILVNAIKASNAHKKTAVYVRENVKPGINLKDIAILVENKIKEETQFDSNNPLNGGIGFPVGLSLNNCAAHYTPNYNEKDIILKQNDILKIDYGTHIYGTIIDSAFTLHFDPKYSEFIKISKNITNFAVSLCGPDVILGEIGREIEEYINSKEITIDNKVYKINIMRDLSGHSISKYEIHAGKAVPNIDINYKLRMIPHEFYAIEPFITTGKGNSILKSPNSHFMLNKSHEINKNNLNTNEKKLYDIIKKNYFTLPFCQRWLYELNNQMNHDQLLKKMEEKNIITAYPPIYDVEKSIVSQFEHTIFIKENGIIKLTENDFY